MENRPIQVSASDVEKAVERGLAQLGLARAQVTVEIIDPGSRGILGIGARDAVVRLQPLADTMSLDAAEEDKVEETSVDEAEEAAADTEIDLDESWDADTHTAEQGAEEYTFSQNQVADIARQTLAELLDKMGIECEVTIRAAGLEPDSAPITLDVSGDDLDVLIGKQGEVLNALQYIARLIVSREVEHWVNMVVDVEKYKQRRAQSLKQLAERIAERVASTRQPVALEPMPPNERRVIHVTLHDHPTVTTQSVGKGDNRKVTIIPRR
jgi:spoIIIJ-associated protein